jgi:shikimate dehydrogenase
LNPVDGALRLALVGPDQNGSPGSSPATIVAGLVGRGIQESRTPLMHEAEGARLGLAYSYRLFDFDRLGLDDDRLPDVLAAAAEAGIAGVNVTHPFKRSAVACLDDLSPDAAAIGAVNTIVFRNGKATGHNTDRWGFEVSFAKGMAGVNLDRVLLAGAGGGGMAVAHALLGLGTSTLEIFDPNLDRAAALAANLASAFGAGRARATSDLPRSVSVADGLVNASPIGMEKYPGSPVPAGLLRRELWVADIVYFPAETELLGKARSVGCRTLDGSGMAIFQAVKAFELITDVTPDANEMARHFAGRE